MKALTLWQPWASLVAIGAKSLETRSWRTDYRGPLAIHAATAYPPLAQQLVETEPFWSTLRASRLHTWNLPRGVVVATCRLVDCLEVGREPAWRQFVQARIDARLLPRHEFHFGDFREGRYAWALDEVRQLDPPVPARGRLGLWEWRPEQAA